MSPNLKVAVIGRLSTITVLPQTVSSRATRGLYCAQHDKKITTASCFLVITCALVSFSHIASSLSHQADSLTQTVSDNCIWVIHALPLAPVCDWICHTACQCSCGNGSFPCPGSSLLWWHVPCMCTFACMGPHTKSGVCGVTTLCCVLLPRLWCALQESSGSNTRWLLILGCSICYAGAPPSLVFHVERRRTRHVS